MDELLLSTEKPRVLAAIERLLMGESRTAVILEYAEVLAPAGDPGFQSDADRAAVVTLHRWSFLPEIERSDNVVILIAENLAELSPGPWWLQVFMWRPPLPLALSAGSPFALLSVAFLARETMASFAWNSRDLCCYLVSSAPPENTHLVRNLVRLPFGFLAPEKQKPRRWRLVNNLIWRGRRRSNPRLRRDRPEGAGRDR